MTKIKTCDDNLQTHLLIDHYKILALREEYKKKLEEVQYKMIDSIYHTIYLAKLEAIDDVCHTLGIFDKLNNNGYK